MPQILVSLIPVLLFLVTLILLDSYKLVNVRSIILTILFGCGTAWISLWINTGLLTLIGWRTELYSQYFAPIIEESLKSAYVIYLIKSKRVGFMVDGAIVGFAVGAGFALVENVYYLNALADPNILLWIIRGFGTATMHGGTTAMFGVISKNLSDRFPSRSLTVFLPGLLLAMTIHSFFNHFLLPAMLETLILLTLLPTLFMLVFKQSESSTRAWLGVGLDADMELLNLITTGNLSESNIGKYLHSLHEKFPGEIIVDMLCLLRLHTELAIRSKGILMLREMGFKEAPDPEIKEKFAELKYLEKSLGAIGKLAIAPFLHTTSRDLWQIYMLET